MSGRDVKNITRPHFDYAAVIHGGGGAAGDDHADVLDAATLRANGAADVLLPLPAGLIRGTPDGHAAEVYQLELALLKRPGLVRLLEALENHVGRRFLHTSSSISASSLRSSWLSSAS